MTTAENATSVHVAGPEKAQGELLDVRGVADELACSMRHVHRLVDAGKMPRPVRLGALVRWRRGEINAWIAAGCPAINTVKGGA